MTDSEATPLVGKPPKAEKFADLDKAVRTIGVCQRCRVKKTKCDRQLPQCLRCLKAKVPCFSMDPVTGQEIPRSYLHHLEQKVRILEAQLKSQGRSSTVTSNYEAYEPGSNSVDSITGTAGVLNGTSPASFSNHMANSVANSLPTSVVSPVQIKPESQQMNYSSLVRLDLVSDQVVVSTADLYIGSMLGVTFAKLMLAALKINSLSSTEQLKVNMSMAAPPTVRPAMLPPKATAEQFLHIYFTQSNSQLPILHRDAFLRQYFEPVYGPWESNLNLGSIGPLRHSGRILPVENTWFYQYKQKLSSHFNETGLESESAQNISDEMEVPSEYRKPLFFLNMVFALAASANHLQYVSTISELFKSSAFKYLEEAEGSEDPLDKLEITLLMALFSLMRPAVPGVWYVLGKALRVCVDLGLHNDSTDKTKNCSAYTKDRRRRLFWCTYALDRQVCFYLGRPVGIPEASITTPFPSSLDDSLISEDATDIEDYSYVVGKIPSSKSIALMIFCIRQIQLEVQRTLYENEELPRRFSTLDEWKIYIHAKLENWWEKTPKRALETACDFNVEYFMLNYNHTLHMIHGLSPKSYDLTKDAYLRVLEATRNVMSCYTQLYAKKAVNYTWAAVYNLFMAGTSFLFSIYHCDEARQRYPENEVRRMTSFCVVVLGSMKDSCDAAQGCSEMYQTLAAAVLKLRYGEKLPESEETLEHASLENATQNSRMKVDAIVNGSGHDAKSDISRNDFSRNEFTRNSDLESVSWTPPWPEKEFGPMIVQSLNLDNFFEELVNMSPSEDQSSSGNDMDMVLDQDGLEGQYTQEGRKVLELIHQVPGEPIWDQFFSSDVGRRSFS